MNEVVKKYAVYAFYFVLVVIVAGTIWLLFRDIRTDDDTDREPERLIERTEEQQRKAEAEIAAVRERAAGAEQATTNIADLNSGGTTISDRIADSQQAAQAGVSAAKESADRITEQSDRIAEAGQRAEGEIATAELANQSAQAALERALQLCRECRELNTSSQSIITTGQGRDASGSEST